MPLEKGPFPLYTVTNVTIFFFPLRELKYTASENKQDYRSMFMRKDEMIKVPVIHVAHYFHGDKNEEVEKFMKSQNHLGLSFST